MSIPSATWCTDDPQFAWAIPTGGVISALELPINNNVSPYNYFLKKIHPNNEINAPINDNKEVKIITLLNPLIS